MVAGLGTVVSAPQLSGASPLPHSTEFQLWNASECGKGLAPDEALNRAANQPASNQTPVAAEAAPATRTNGAAAVGSQRTTA
jgi:hypothetical protein